jgi:hypothetical protein
VEGFGKRLGMISNIRNCNRKQKLHFIKKWLGYPN